MTRLLAYSLPLTLAASVVVVIVFPRMANANPELALLAGSADHGNFRVFLAGVAILIAARFFLTRILMLLFGEGGKQLYRPGLKVRMPASFLASIAYPTAREGSVEK